MAASPLKTPVGVQGLLDIWLSSHVEGRLGRIKHHFRFDILQRPAALRMRPFVYPLGSIDMLFQIKPLGCDPARLRGLSEKLIVSHYENNYSGAVKRLNAIVAQLESLDVGAAPVFALNGLKREQLIAANSMILHELYFSNLGPDGPPGVVLAEALAHDFGSFERWRAEFVAMGKALGGGSGWVLLTYSHRDGVLLNQWASDHAHVLAGATPILALDMYEHSYHMDYGAKAAVYVDAFMENVDWTNVGKLYEQCA